MSVRHGRLVVLEDLGVIQGSRRLRCACDCGEVVTVRANDLRPGKTQSCGCLRREVTTKGSRARFRHGNASNGCRTKAYRTWTRMRSRCNSPSNPGFEDYGGRGITICERWESFENFLADMGEPQPHQTIDRIDNEGDYEPGNCRWTTTTVQSRNKRSTRLTPDLVNEIRGRYEHGEGPASIAARLGQNPRNVEKVIRRRSWADIP